MINPSKHLSGMALTVVFACMLVMPCLMAADAAMGDSVRSADRLREAELLFKAGDYSQAERLFRAELDVPEKINGSDFVGVTPKRDRVRIWLARCQGRLGQKDAALTACLQLARETQDVRNWWGPGGRELLAKTMVENARTTEQMAEVEKIAGTLGFRELQEYFAALALVKQDDARGVVLYLTRSDVRIIQIEPALWRDEIAERAAALKPAMIRYTMEQVEQAARLENPDLALYHLHHLLQILPDERFVEPCLGSVALRNRFRDSYNHWLDILRVHRQACKRTALLHLGGDRNNKEHALMLVNALRLYDREIMDAVAAVAAEEYYPTQVESLSTFWIVSGQQFGLEAETDELQKQPVSDEALRAACARAIEWWNRSRSSLDGAAPVPVQTANMEVLERGLRSRCGAIYREAIKLMSIEKQRVVEKKDIEPTSAGDVLKAAPEK